MFLTLVIGGLMLIVAYWLSCSPFRWSNRGIKWMIPWPFLGNTASSLTQPYFVFWRDLYSKMEGHKMIGFHMFTTPAILPRDPEIFKMFMITDAESYTSHGFYTDHRDPFGRNLFYIGGEEWRVTRSKMTPYFSPSRIKGMVPIIDNVVSDYVDYLERSSKLGPVALDDASMKLSTDVLVSTTFGLQPEAFKNSQSFFVVLQKELLGFLFGLKILIGIFSPALYGAMRLTSFTKETTSKLRYFVVKVIESRLRGEGVRPDFMQGMIELYKEEQLSDQKLVYNKDGTRIARFNELGVTAQCMIMFAAGTDTTGHSLTFMLYELTLNQAIQERLRREIMDTVEKTATLGYEEISTMAYLDMVYSETLRKYPSAPLVARKCTKKTKLGGLDILPGTMVLVPIGGVHWDPKFYPRPERFDPERFAPGVQRELGTYLPFGLGPRMCIGMKLAQIEVKLAVCKLLMKFKLARCDKTQLDLEFGFGPNLCPRTDIYVDLQPLNEQK